MKLGGELVYCYLSLERATGDLKVVLAANSIVLSVGTNLLHMRFRIIQDIKMATRSAKQNLHTHKTPSL